MKSRKIEKILIANRGEIAVRIIRACQEMGIKSVAVFSDVDRTSPHVLMADEAYYLGAPPASDSYLNQQKIIEIARQAGVDAIHPGYGFLAENPDFARLVETSGFIFIGPRAETLELMGNKTASRRQMDAAGVPIIPGTKEPIADLKQAKGFIKKIGGYPILLKASAGGGGKGMRVVHSASELERAFLAARNEAQKAFGNPEIYIEKYISSPRHIEFQILADNYGNAIYLMERECSIQRRHQKLIEECPSVMLSEEKRREMGAIAVKAAQACNYRNAGTVEFLIDETGQFYFLEMNTRLQVEHPVTELALGIDLVKLQIQIASGNPLPLKQEEIKLVGHAIECRINAEDVWNNFAPSSGRIQYYHPPDGPGIRVDSGINSHSEVTMFYDPLIAKLIVQGSSREEAILRMRRALREFKISGIQTTIPFAQFVMRHPEFQRGNFDTNFVEKYWEKQKDITVPDSITNVIAVALKYHLSKERISETLISDHGTPAQAISPWKLRGLPKAFRLK